MQIIFFLCTLEIVLLLTFSFLYHLFHLPQISFKHLLSVLNQSIIQSTTTKVHNLLPDNLPNEFIEAPSDSNLPAQIQDEI